MEKQENKICSIYDNTVEDYLMLPQGMRVELINGKFYDMVTPNLVHSYIATNLIAELQKFIKQNHCSCMLFAAPAGVQLDEDDMTMVQPDIFITSKQGKIQEERFYGAPDFVVEIVSHNSWYVDVLKKKEKYERAGVKEYWIIFPEEQKVTVCLLEGEKRQADYTFHDKVPVEIWNGKCEIDLSEINIKDRFRIGEKTIEDYIALPEDVMVELIDGEFYDMSHPITMHSRMVGLLAMKLQSFINQNHLCCIPFFARATVQLDKNDMTVVQPSIFIVCDINQVRTERIYGAPDFVVEIVSPGNWYVDVIIKKAKYEQAGVKEYWMIFPDEQKVKVCWFEGEKKQIDYTFQDKIPVGIWDGKCEIDFAEIYESI